MSDAMRYKRCRWRAMCASMASLAPSMNAAGVGLALNALTSRYKARDADATTAMTKEGWARMAEGVSRAFGAEGTTAATIGSDPPRRRVGRAARHPRAARKGTRGNRRRRPRAPRERRRLAPRRARVRRRRGRRDGGGRGEEVPGLRRRPGRGDEKDYTGRRRKNNKIVASNTPGQQPLLRGWDALAARVVSTIPWDPVHVTIFASALGWLPALAEALARRPGGFARVVACFERRREDCVSGIDPDAPAGRRLESRKWMEKTAAG